MELVVYDAACKMLAQARSVDEVKDLRDKAEAMRAYARQAKNRDLEVDAAEIRIRAERRLGEMIRAQKETVGLNQGTRSQLVGPSKKEAPRDDRPRLADAGIDAKLSSRAQKMAAVPEHQFEAMIGDWRGRIEAENDRVTTNLLRAGERASQGRRENDFYPTPDSIVAQIVQRWRPRARVVWEPCDGDGRVRIALHGAGFEVVAGDIATGQDFFACSASPMPGIALCTNPPFERVREFIDHAFAIGIQEMCLVLPERMWASGIGREQFERHRPAIWANMDWREDYLGKGGSPDRALAVAIWDSPCAPSCSFEVWSREEQRAAAPLPPHDPITGEIFDDDPPMPVPDPHSSKADGGQPQSSVEAGAKCDGRDAIVGRAPVAGGLQSGKTEQQTARAAQDRNPPVSASDASATPSDPAEKPGCRKLKNGACKLSSVTSALCSDCRQAELRARASA